MLTSPRPSVAIMVHPNGDITLRVGGAQATVTREEWSYLIGRPQTAPSAGSKPLPRRPTVTSS